ncbi:MAG: cell division protein FtsZ, partial [Xanthobacteraceae bacterium]
AVMREKGKAMMGRGEASGERRVLNAAVAAISNPLIEDPSIKRASGLIISITGGKDLSLFEVDEAANRIREEADQDANIIVGASFDEGLEGIVRVSVVATGIDIPDPTCQTQSAESLLTKLAGRLRNVSRHIERNALLPQSESPPALPAASHPQGRPANPDSQYARHAPPHGRSAPARNFIDDKVLDIPTFLRRKAS